MLKINAPYADKETIKGLQQGFLYDKELPSIQLLSFFEKKSYDLLRKMLISLRYQKKKHPIEHAYKVAKIPFSIQKVFSSSALLSLLSHVIRKKVKSLEMQCLSFSWKDYTILHDQTVKATGYDIFFDFTDDWKETHGGALVYVDGTGSYSTVSAEGNKLVVVKRNKGVQHFLQYVNHLAGKKKRYILMGRIIV
jgi:Rps23 Pro-64 3,4-dihydroxylase Tpa1-like proline 4-hydroxylase